ncbi:MAG: hypothetical protein ACE5FS_02800, partial [Paracoccaceae bacterium]
AAPQPPGPSPRKDDAAEQAQRAGSAAAGAGATTAAAEAQDTTAATRAALIGAFKAMGPGLKSAVAAADAEMSKKLTQLAKAFPSEVKGQDLSRAGKILSLLKKMIGEVPAAQSAPATGGGDTAKPAGEEKGLLDKMKDLSGEIGDVIEEADKFLDETIEDIKEVAEDTAQAFGDTLGILSEADQKQKARLKDSGLSDDDQLLLVQRNRDDPKAIERALAALAPMKEVNVPASQRLRLIDLSQKSPKLFKSAIAALKSMDAKGAVDVSPKAITASLKNINAIQTERIANADKWRAQNEKTKAAKAELATKQAAEVKAKEAADAAQAAIKAFKESLPDVKKMSSAQRDKFAAESRKLINANEDAKAKLQAAKTATAGALTAAQAAEAALNTCYDAWKASDDKRKAALAAQKAIDDKRGLIDAVSFGPLSPGAAKPMDAATAQKFVDAYAKDPGLARQAIELAGDSDDPSALAANVGMVCDKFADGFADKDGKKLACSDDDRRLMAQNALKMGARLGDDYFKGFSAYLASGKQHKTDPCGGASSPAGDPKVETARKNAINLKRTGMMSAAILGDDGKVDVTSAKAKAAMEHMLYHPGSLQTPSPAMTEQMQKVMKTFSDPKTAAAAQKVITDVKKPTNGSAKSIVRGTVGKKTGDLTDNDTRQAVLSAMMTPLAQGPVGSCFTTAPARKIRESNPVEAMKSFAEIATTGRFTPKVGDAVPANANLPKGENPLMRSWEYSAATAAARLRDSEENRLLNDALLGGNVAGKDLNGIKGIVGEDAWKGKGLDPKTGKFDPGVKGKIQAAIKQKLQFFYNAGPRVGDTDGGGGDGKSTDGGYEIKYKGKAVKSEADFLAAIKEIALGAAGVNKDSDKGKAIIALVSDPAFKESIFKAYTAADKDYKPWDLVGGGFEDQATKVLSGGTQRRRSIIDKKGALGGDEGDRTRAVLDNLLTGLAGKTDKMITIGTGGKNAQHAFNALPNHPSFNKIKDPDSDKKIKALLLDPGKKIASTKMPAARAGALFEKQIRKLSDGWGWRDGDLLTAALDKRPTEDMTPGELNKLIKSVLKDFEKKQVERRLADWKKEEEGKGHTVTTAKLDEKKVDLTKDVSTWVSGGIDQMLVAEFNPPEVVIADTNWGGPEDQKYFVIAPDPSTGELRMWEKGAFSGSMTPKGQNWIDGNWTKLE